MELEILDTKTFKEVQEAFNKVYPFLWIDFSGPLATGTAGFPKPERLTAETHVGKLCSFSGIKTIAIDGDKSVAQLETDFWEVLHVKIKVLRKSGNVWVATSYTGNWTLANQNQEGEQIGID